MTTPDNPQYQVRVARLQKWQSMGVDPFGQRTDGLVKITDARARHKGTEVTPHDGTDSAKVAGRIVLYRDTGKLIFLTIQDWTGRIQIALSKKEFPAGAEELAANPQASSLAWQQAKMLELADLAWFEGPVGHTKTGEVTIWAKSFGLLTKALLPPPDKFHGLSDTELRYRQRYVDLFANPDSMDDFIFRSKMIDSIRDFLRNRNFLEVETPMMQAIAGGAAARPFITHHNALDIDLFMRISPELYLKRLLVGGMERVFEINRNFRNEGIDTTHNPEFTMMEVYQAYSDLEGMMELTESLFVRLAKERLQSLGKEAGKLHIQFGERIFDFSPPFARVSYAELFQKHVGVDMNNIEAVLTAAAQRGINTANKEHDVIVGELFEHLAEPTLASQDRPVFLYDYPAALCPLTKRKPGNPRIAERFELYVAGMELANAYTELNDPFVQEETFSKQLQGQKEEDSMAKMDDDFITALRYGMPPAGGLGIGIDRLAMLLMNRQSIRDVVLFPMLRPPKGEAGEGGNGSPATLFPRNPFETPGTSQMERDLARIESDLQKASAKGKIPLLFAQDKDGSLRLLDM